MMYLPADDGETIHVFASKAGAPTNPDWYSNLTTSGTGRVEVASNAYSVTVTELLGDETVR